MTRWQELAETNPSASPEQQTLLGLMVLAELENSGSGPVARPETHPDSAAPAAAASSEKP